MEKVDIFSSIEQIDSSIQKLNEFEKFRCLRAFSIPLSNTNKYLKKITTDDIMIILVFVSTLFLFLVSTSERMTTDENDDKSINKTKESIFTYIKDKLSLSNQTLRYTVCFIALIRIAYEIFMVNYKNMKYSLTSRRNTMFINIFLIITILLATSTP